MRHLLWGVLLGLVTMTISPLRAAACGGTFCDGSPGQLPMPVDQTGENILFIQDGSAIEAHIQIQYTGEPQRFAWVVPIPAIPEFRIGSDLMFREMLRGSAPAYVVRPALKDTCAEELAPYLLAAPLLLLAPLVPLLTLPLFFFAHGCANSELVTAKGAGGDATAASVVFRDSVGAFDITVLQASTSEEVTRWLADNNYTIPPSAAAILRQYAQENSLFAAIKLTSTSHVDEIHPIVLRYEHGVPCIPLRLTALAATSNMGVRAFFLGQGRTVPRTYRHVLVNPARMDWINKGANYMDVVSHAVDDDTAGGQGFVTEYAGPSTVALANNFRWWTVHGLEVGAAATTVVTQLTAAGFMDCDGVSRAPTTVTGVTPPNSCTFYHPLVHGLLQDFLPAPNGVTERDFWSDPQRYITAAQSAQWDAVAFAKEFDDRIDLPAQRALSLLLGHPYLTRMFTTISPEEMTVDPEFHERLDLPNVTNIQVASQQVHCDGITTVTLPDGHNVAVGSDGKWPTFNARMPWALRVEDVPATGSIMPLAEHSAEIDKELSRWNDSKRPVQASRRCQCSTAEPLLPTLGLCILFLAGRVRRRR